MQSAQLTATLSQEDNGKGGTLGAERGLKLKAIVCWLEAGGIWCYGCWDSVS